MTNLFLSTKEGLTFSLDDEKTFLSISNDLNIREIEFTRYGVLAATLNVPGLYMALLNGADDPFGRLLSTYTSIKWGIDGASEEDLNPHSHLLK